MRNHILSITVVLMAAAAAHAGALAQESLALGYQAEHADLVAMGSLVGADRDAAGNVRATFSITEVLRGDVEAGASVIVAYPNLGHRPPWRAGSSHLLFLSRRRETANLWTTVSGPASIRVIPKTGAVARLPEMVRKIAATLETDSRDADPDALRSLLVGWMQDPEPGVAWSAAVDFVRRRDLHEGLSDADRQRVLAAFVSHPYGKASKAALVMAVAAARPSEAGEALVSALLDESGRSIRVVVADALREIADPKVPASIASKLEGADGRARADLIQVLGAVGGGGSVDVVRRHVSDKSAEVQLEAAHALGLIARTVREEKPAAVVSGTTDLEGMLAASKDRRGQQATKLAKDDEREFVRTWAGRYRDRPRLSLILR